MTNSNLKKLKLVSLIGGIYEIFFGIILIFFIVPLLNLLGLNITQLEYPIFAHTGGLLAIIIGLMLSFSAYDVEKYLLNIILIIILRLIIQIVIIVNIFLIPTIGLGLLIFGLIDLIFALITIFLIKTSNLPFNLFKIIK
ncbi:hypothetical protein LCGC14_0616070 [marine sediment metagenome]|uniref:Uncharacterized protein n=1 Tax=marine sediment metagenome TaxID=412755 RepID=A0A0F9UEP8_9ZZZZ